GTYVVKKTGSGATDITALIIAGGGGAGGGNNNPGNGQPGLTGTSGGNDTQGSYTGGSNGSGGNTHTNGSGGGGGLTGNSTNSYSETEGISFTNGGAGGDDGCNYGGLGGFGGGGGGEWCYYGSPGGGGGYSGGAGTISTGLPGGGGSYSSSSTNASSEEGAREGHGQVVINYCAGFCFESASVVANNNYVDITFTAGAYSTSGGSGALEAADFSLTFASNGGPASAASISSVKKNNNASEG
ncbi:uncharacterized protein METZ01_LOCUS481292, partial [marine metagenome]